MIRLHSTASDTQYLYHKQENNMSDKWHEMLDHLVNKNEDKAKEAFQNIINTEKETFMAQDAIEPEVVEAPETTAETPVDEVPSE